MARNVFIDYLKGIAIFLVVWGHGIQYLDKENNFYNNWLFLFIYSFHMPLFMCISGYLFAYSAKKRFYELFKSKMKQLIIPVLCWGVFFTLLVHHKQLEKLSLIGMLNNYFLLYLNDLPYHLWFLWSLFIISIIVSLLSTWRYNPLLLNGIFFLLLLCIPDYFGFSYVKFMYPFFLMGYIFNLNSCKLQKFKKNVVLASSIIFPICLLFWTKTDLIYVTKMSFYDAPFQSHLAIIYFRFLTGFTGVIACVNFIRKFLYFPNVKFITTMGVYSLGIYILQTLLYVVISKYSPVRGVNEYIYTFIFTSLVSVLVIIISISITKCIGKISSLSKLLFGGRY